MLAGYFLPLSLCHPPPSPPSFMLKSLNITFGLDGVRSAIFEDTQINVFETKTEKESKTGKVDVLFRVVKWKSILP